MMFWYGGGGWPFWEVGLMWVVMIAFWGLLIWGIYALVTGAGRRPESKPDGDAAARILDERLARGEIDAAEYQRLKDVMADSRVGSHAGAGSGR
ncbi:MAG TPA: SHOCT domain-containing protein [Streptosporangiaceae bacterium]|nr:SHOCT domain-containing protein [Streptosporangiaceae bacterium]